MAPLPLHAGGFLGSDSGDGPVHGGGGLCPRGRLKCTTELGNLEWKSGQFTQPLVL